VDILLWGGYAYFRNVTYVGRTLGPVYAVPGTSNIWVNGAPVFIDNRGGSPFSDGGIKPMPPPPAISMRDVTFTDKMPSKAQIKALKPLESAGGAFKEMKGLLTWEAPRGVLGGKGSGGALGRSEGRSRVHLDAKLQQCSVCNLRDGGLGCHEGGRWRGWSTRVLCGHHQPLPITCRA
jgi:hypothetical protein